MNVVQVTFEIPVIADQVLPESPLPDGALSLLDASSGAPLPEGNSSREPCLDIVPPCREIAVAREKRPDAVQMISEDDAGVDLEGPAPLGIGENRPQVIDVLGKQLAPSFEQRYCEEESAAGNEGSDVSGHDGSLPRKAGCAVAFPPYELRELDSLEIRPAEHRRARTARGLDPRARGPRHRGKWGREKIARRRRCAPSVPLARHSVISDQGWGTRTTPETQHRCPGRTG
jgi:hypothetical protein